MRVLVTLFALIVAYIAGTMVSASIMRNSNSGVRYVLSLVVAALVAAVVYTAMKNGPRGVLGIIRRR